LRNVEDLRELAHELTVILGDVLRQPAVRLAFTPLDFMVLCAGTEVAHSVVCDKAIEGTEDTETVEGSLGTPNIPGLESLADIFKDL